MAGASLLDLARQVQVLLVVLLLLLCSFWVSSAHADDLDYRLRGSEPNQYYEGRAPNQVNGADVTLLSARIEDSTDNKSMTKMPANIGVRIKRSQLVDAKDVELKIGEIHQYTYYNFNRENHNWYSESDFSWSTDAMKRMGVDLENLGVVAKLRDKKEVGSEWIAPVIVYYDKILPKRSDTYLFALRLAEEASSLNCSIYYGEKIIQTSDECKPIRVGEPFDFKWFGVNS